MRSSRCVPPVSAVMALVFVLACERAPLSDPFADSALLSAQARSLITCPVGEAYEFRQVAGPDGALLSGGGVAVAIPAGALTESVEFTVHVPSSPYVEVDITAAGHEHYQFVKPVAVTLDYSRCSNGAPPSLSAWYIDTSTKALLENMSAVDDRPNRRLTFSTVHLSGYAIAN